MRMFLLAMSDFCKRLDYSNLGNVAKCLNEVTLQNDAKLGAILLTIMFAGLLIRYNFPVTLLLPFTMALSFTMWLLVPSATVFLGIFMLTLIIGGAVLIMSILKAINR